VTRPVSDIDNALCLPRYLSQYKMNPFQQIECMDTDSVCKGVRNYFSKMSENNFTIYD